MSTARIIGRVRSCAECPRRMYWSGGNYQCAEISQPLTRSDIIPAFCPLPQDPAALLAKSQWEEKNVTAMMQVAANEAMTASEDRLRHLVLTTAAQLGVYPQEAAKAKGEPS